MKKRLDSDRTRTSVRMQCAALSDHGKRCRKLTYRLYSYSGDSEGRAYGGTAWVQVALCDAHHPIPPGVPR